MPQARDEAGNIWEVDAQGNAVRLVQAAPQQQQMPENPTYQYEAPQAEADVQRTRTQTQGDAISNAVTQGTAPTTIQTNQAPAGFMWVDPTDPTQGVVRIPGYTADGEGETSDKAVAARRLLEMLDGPGGIQQQFNTNFEGQGFFGTLNEYSPFRTENQTFDSKANAMLPFAKKLLRTPGEGAQSDKEAADYRAQLPSSSNRDDTNAQLIRDLRQTALSVLEGEGFDPSTYDSKGGFVEQPEDQSPPSVFDVTRVGSNTPQREAGGFGATARAIPAPPEMVREHEQMIYSLMEQGGGRLDPQAYARARAALDQKYGRGSVGQADLEGWATRVNEYLDAGGRTVPSGISDESEVLGMAETLRNKMVANPLGAGIAGAANTASFGIPEALLNEKYGALGDAYPTSTTVGEIGGSIAGTLATGGIARGIGGKVAPKIASRLMGGGARGQFARNVGTDVAYGTGYGTVTGRDPLESAVLSGVGSVGGQGLGKLTGSAIGGLSRTAPAQALMNNGVVLSVGRQLGDATSRAEDLLQSVPLVGGRVRARQEDAFRSFNEAAFREGAKPLEGFNPTAYGREGLDQFDSAVGKAYTDALQGRSVPLDRQFNLDLQPAAATRTQLPDDVMARADKLIDNHLLPIDDAGEITGDAYQRARRGLGKARNNANQIAGEFDQPYRETMTGVLDALDAQLARGGGEDVIAGLNRANAANKNYNILENASLDAAKIGTQAGEVNVFTPAQLLAASRASEKKYGSDGVLRNLGEQGQQVLPQTIPNSGTTDRAIAAGALGTVGVGLPGLGYAIDGTDGAQTGAYSGAGLASALALLGTRRGQQAVQKVLIDRPEIAQRVGRSINGRRGLFGSGTVPLVIPQAEQDPSLQLWQFAQ